MRHTILLFAGMIVLAIFSMSCGGDGVVPTTPAPPTPQTEYRLTLIEGWQGGVATTSIKARQGVLTPFEVRYDFRTSSMGGNWSPVAQDSTLDVTIEGAASGHKMPDIGLTGGQYRIRTGTCRLEFFPPIGGQLGSTYLVLRVRESGASVRVAINILPQSGGNPPPPPSCRDLHPTKEAINGFWWDCLDGVWANTGEPVNPPPPPVTYFLHIYGAQGEFTEGGTINIEEGNGYQLQVWELQGSDGSKVSLDGFAATMESSYLPFWVWDPAHKELITVLWANPNYPDPLEPGNIFIEPGSYPIGFSVSYGGKTYYRSGTLKVLDRPDFP